MALTTLRLAPNPAQEDELNLGSLSMGTAGAKPALTESLGASIAADRQSAISGSGSSMTRRSFIGTIGGAMAAPFVIGNTACAQEKVAGHAEVTATQGSAASTQGASTSTQTASASVQSTSKYADPAPGLTSKEYSDKMFAELFAEFNITEVNGGSARDSLQSVLNVIDEELCNLRYNCSPSEREEHRKIAMKDFFNGVAKRFAQNPGINVQYGGASWTGIKDDTYRASFTMHRELAAEKARLTAEASK